MVTVGRLPLARVEDRRAQRVVEDGSSPFIELRLLHVVDIRPEIDQVCRNFKIAGLERNLKR